MQGDDVVELQNNLRAAGFANLKADGVFGNNTVSAIKTFQEKNGLVVDGIVGKITWNALLEISKSSENLKRFAGLLPELTRRHRFQDSVSWTITARGISIDGKEPEYSAGQPKTVARVWNELRQPLLTWSKHYGVPVELIIATICTESGGNLQIKAREEPGYKSDQETPHRVSPGIMQTLISTARAALSAGSEIDRAWLEQPANSIQAGTAYIASQSKITHFDPPKVACAYNAGGIYHNDSPKNRWKMRQYPIGTDAHVNRYVQWFNDCFRVFEGEADVPAMSFFSALQDQLIPQPS